MYHARFKGSHYAAGFKYGALLREHGHVITSCPTFELTDEVKAFAAECVPIYESFYPEILREIQGICDGQQTDSSVIIPLLLSMYCFKPENHCTAFAISDGENILLGKNSDFLVSLEKLYMNCLYSLDGVFAFNGNTTAFVEIEDGMNEHGLAAALTFLYPHTRKPGFNAGMLIRYILEKCSTTAEAVSALQTLPIASAQTVTLCDKSGSIAVVELNSEASCVRCPTAGKRYIAAANCFVSDEMQPYRTPMGIDSWRSEERYCTAVNALEANASTYSLDLAKRLLSGEFGFICQYDRKTNADTVWSAIYDAKNLRFYRVEGNPSRKPFKEDTRMKLSKGRT